MERPSTVSSRNGWLKRQDEQWTRRANSYHLLLSQLCTVGVRRQEGQKRQAGRLINKIFPRWLIIANPRQQNGRKQNAIPSLAVVGIFSVTCVHSNFWEVVHGGVTIKSSFGVKVEIT
jgi:hypothetical protein